MTITKSDVVEVVEHLEVDVSVASITDFAGWTVDGSNNRIHALSGNSGVEMYSTDGGYVQVSDSGDVTSLLGYLTAGVWGFWVGNEATSAGGFGGSTYATRTVTINTGGLEIIAAGALELKTAGTITGGGVTIGSYTDFSTALQLDDRVFVVDLAGKEINATVKMTENVGTTLTVSGSRTLYGNFTQLSTSGAGIALGLYGNYVDIDCNTSSSPYGISIDVDNAGAGNAYGVYIGAITSAGSAYGIYNLCASKNYFAGDVFLASGKKVGLDGDDGNDYIIYEGSEVRTYIAGTERLAVTSTGVTVTGGYSQDSGNANGNNFYGQANFRRFSASTYAVNINPTAGALDGVQVGLYSAPSGSLTSGAANAEYQAFRTVLQGDTVADQDQKLTGMYIQITGKNDDGSIGIDIAFVQSSSTTSGDAYGIYIRNGLSSTSGTAYPIYSAATEQSYFAGDIALASGKFLVLDGAGGNEKIAASGGYIYFTIGGATTAYVDSNGIALVAGKRLTFDNTGGNEYFLGSGGEVHLYIGGTKKVEFETGSVTAQAPYYYYYLSSSETMAASGYGFRVNVSAMSGGGAYSYYGTQIVLTTSAVSLIGVYGVYLTLTTDTTGNTYGIFFSGSAASSELYSLYDNSSTAFLKLSNQANATIVAASPSDGSIVYDLTNDKLMLRANGAWETVTSA